MRDISQRTGADLSASFSPPSPPPPLDLPLGMRLHLPARDNRPARGAPAAHAAPCRAVPRKMALLPRPRSAGTLQRAVLGAELLGALHGHGESAAIDPEPVPAAALLSGVGVFWAGEL